MKTHQKVRRLLLQTAEEMAAMPTKEFDIEKSKTWDKNFCQLKENEAQRLYDVCWWKIVNLTERSGEQDMIVTGLLFAAELFKTKTDASHLEKIAKCHCCGQKLSNQ